MRLASRTLIRVLPLVALLSVALPAAGQKLAPVVGDPVRPGVWRLHGTDPALSQDDLAPLKTLIGKATVVGL